MQQGFLSKIVDKQIGRNAELFAQTISEMDSPEKRFPYLRILIAIIEQAHPEWSQAPQKDLQIAHVIHLASNGKLDREEVAFVVRLRDEEKGIYYD
jgi:hypothetical protein